MNARLKAGIAGVVIAIGGIAFVATSVSAQTGRPDSVEAESVEDINEGPDIPITGPDLDRASAAALDFAGEGRVSETEIEDEESYYEVEVTLDNGSEIDVQLDEGFNVVGTD